MNFNETNGILMVLKEFESIIQSLVSSTKSLPLHLLDLSEMFQSIFLPLKLLLSPLQKAAYCL